MGMLKLRPRGAWRNPQRSGQNVVSIAAFDVLVESISDGAVTVSDGAGAVAERNVLAV